MLSIFIILTHLLIVLYNLSISLVLIIYFIPYYTGDLYNCGEKTNFVYYMIGSSLANIFTWIILTSICDMLIYHNSRIKNILEISVIDFLFYLSVITLNAVSFDIMVNQDILEGRCTKNELLLSKVYIISSTFSPILFILFTILSRRLN